MTGGRDGGGCRPGPTSHLHLDMYEDIVRFEQQWANKINYTSKKYSTEYIVNNFLVISSREQIDRLFEPVWSCLV